VKLQAALFLLAAVSPHRLVIAAESRVVLLQPPLGTAAPLQHHKRLTKPQASGLLVVAFGRQYYFGLQ
jgi:hypothetical protein